MKQDKAIANDQKTQSPTHSCRKMDLAALVAGGTIITRFLKKSLLSTLDGCVQVYRT